MTEGKTEQTILFVGGGNMASAMLGGLLAQGAAKEALRVVEVVTAARAALSERFGVRCHAAVDADAASVDVVVLAVKPQQMRQVAEGLRPFLRGQLVISIAAGIRLVDLARWLGGHGRLVRVMPNMPALIRAGVSGLFAPTTVNEAARRQAEAIVGAIGSSFWVSDEAMMDAVTAVSGSGPGYVFYILEALRDGAVAMGFDATSARQMALETILGAARMAAESSEDFSVLRQRVTSKGGTTEAAFKAMQENGVAAGIVAGMQAALARGREMGIELGRNE